MLSAVRQRPQLCASMGCIVTNTDGIRMVKVDRNVGQPLEHVMPLAVALRFMRVGILCKLSLRKLGVQRLDNTVCEAIWTGLFTFDVQVWPAPETHANSDSGKCTNSALHDSILKGFDNMFGNRKGATQNTGIGVDDNISDSSAQNTELEDDVWDPQKKVISNCVRLLSPTLLQPTIYSLQLMVTWVMAFPSSPTMF